MYTCYIDNETITHIISLCTLSSMEDEGIGHPTPFKSWLMPFKCYQRLYAVYVLLSDATDYDQTSLWADNYNQMDRLSDWSR